MIGLLQKHKTVIRKTFGWIFVIVLLVEDYLTHDEISISIATAFQILGSFAVVNIVFNMIPLRYYNENQGQALTIFCMAVYAVFLYLMVYAFFMADSTTSLFFGVFATIASICLILSGFKNLDRIESLKNKES